MVQYQPLEPVFYTKLGLTEFSALQSQMADVALVLFGFIILMAMYKFYLSSLKWHAAQLMEERLADGVVFEGDSLETVARLKAAVKDDFLRTFLGLVGISLMMMALTGVLHPSASDLKSVAALEQEIRPYVAQAVNLLEQALLSLAPYIPW